MTETSSATDELARTIRLYTFPKNLRWMSLYGDEILQEFWRSMPVPATCVHLKNVRLISSGHDAYCHYWTTTGMGSGANISFFMERHPGTDVTISVQFPAKAEIFPELVDNQTRYLDPVVEQFNMAKDQYTDAMKKAVTRVWQNILGKLPETYYHSIIQGQRQDLMRAVQESKLRMTGSFDVSQYYESRLSLPSVHPDTARNKFLFGNQSIEFIYTFTQEKPGCPCESLNASFNTWSFVLLTDSQSIYSSRPEIADFASRLEKMRQLFNETIVREIIRRKTDVDASAFAARQKDS